MSAPDYFTLPDLPSKCTWSAAKGKSESVHHHQAYPRPKPKILPNILYHVGDTPMVRLNRIGKNDGLACELSKCEFFNAGGSVKDRISVRMIEDAERDGRLKPGMTLIEPTSGNTGIGLALAAAVKGYRCIIVMPERMSQEKEDTMKALGAEIIRTPTSAKFDSPESHIGVALRLSQEIPDSIVLNQYNNRGNPLAHYDQTAEEILDQCDGHVDMVVIGTGTGGTTTGVGRKLKERCPGCIVVGADPAGSILMQPDESTESDEPASSELEGVGYDFVPTVLDRSVVDVWIKTKDKDSFLMARRLIKEEGLLSGGSSGAIVSAALQAAKCLKSGQKCVVMLPDGVRNYMTKFLNDNWMAERDFIDIDSEFSSTLWWWNLQISQLPLLAPVTITPKATVQAAMVLMDKEALDQLPVVAEDGTLIGVVTHGDLVSNLITNKVRPEAPVEGVLCKEFTKLFLHTTLGKMFRALENDRFAVIVQQQKQLVEPNAPCCNEGIVGLVTRNDLLNFVTSRDSIVDCDMKNGVESLNSSGRGASPSSGLSL